MLPESVQDAHSELYGRRLQFGDKDQIFSIHFLESYSLSVYDTEGRYRRCPVCRRLLVDAELVGDKGGGICPYIASEIEIQQNLKASFPELFKPATGNRQPATVV